MITFYCGKCGVKVRVPALEAGKTTRCEECRAKLPVPRTYFDRPQMRFFCPACEARVRAWVDQAGESMRCPNCEVLIDLPEIDGEAAPDTGVWNPDEWLPPSEIPLEPEEEPGTLPQAAPPAEEAAEPTQEEKPRRKTVRSRRQIRLMIIAAACLVLVLAPLVAIGALRSARPAWLARDLMAAAEGGAYVKSRLLLLCGADIDAKDVLSGGTPLHMASAKGRTSIVKLLLDYDAYVDPEDKSGQTPLCLAVVGGHKEIVECLVNAGADIDFKRPSDGRRLLDIAMAGGHNEIADFLLQKRKEAREREVASSTIYLSSEDEAQGSAERVRSKKHSELRIPNSAFRIPHSSDRLTPVGFYMTYMVKIGIRRLWGAKGEGHRKFVVVVFAGPLDLFKVNEYEFRYMKTKDEKLTSPDLTRSFDPSRFRLILSNGRRVRGSAICPHWTPAEDSPSSNIFHYDLNVGYKSEAEIRRGDLALAWLLDADDCKPPFKIQIDWQDPAPVPNIRFDGADEAP